MTDVIHNYLGSAVLTETIVDPERQETLALVCTLFIRVHPWIGLADPDYAYVCPVEFGWAAEILEHLGGELREMYRVEDEDLDFVWFHDHGQYFIHLVRDLFRVFMSQYTEDTIEAFADLRAFCLRAMKRLDLEDFTGIRQCS